MPARIAVSGVGGGVGQSIIKALYQSDFKIIALDSEHLATGLFATPAGYLIPYASDDRYANVLTKVLRREKCMLLFPGMDAELPKLAAHKQSIEDQSGCRIVVSSPEVIEIADDKLLTQSFLKEYNFPYLQTVPLPDLLNDDRSLDAPFILKPRRGGARSKNVHKVESLQDLGPMLRFIDPSEYVAQEFVEGDEYTCGSVSFDGECFGVIMMTRTLRGGDTYRCSVQVNPNLEAFLYEVIRALKPFGALNIQLRVKDGVPYIFEFNARCSGTTAARALSGFNEPKFVADYLLNGEIPKIDIEKNTILRYWNELVASQDDIDSLQANHSRNSSSYKKL